EAPEHVSALPLERPAPVHYVRGVELAATLSAERESDAHAWLAWLDRVSTPDLGKGALQDRQAPFDSLALEAGALDVGLCQARLWSVSG
ncbi:hypothetical protein, partial [Cupriavidus sp. AU9028]|uniref:hypothetical protein n=1 Tax=Cupriavidus sp. AU9028 TaxID=2871157 RepID=UPI001C9897EB